MFLINDGRDLKGSLKRVSDAIHSSSSNYAELMAGEDKFSEGGRRKTAKVRNTEMQMHFGYMR
jgi:hypothetical protein